MFVKIFEKILDSSIWLESDSTVRVWVTLLVSMDSDGFCQFASIENLSRRARVKPSLTARAIAILEAPDPKSTTPDDDGRRIKRVQGGWLVLNCKKYRDISRHSDLRKSRISPDQLSATQRNSDQLGAPMQLSTNGISESLPEKEIETEKEKRPDFNAQESAMYVKYELGLTGQYIVRDVSEALEAIHGKEGMEYKAAAESFVYRWRLHLKSDNKTGFKSWLQSGSYLQAKPKLPAMQNPRSKTLQALGVIV